MSNTTFVRKWYKMLPMKAAHEKLGVYKGTWSQQMDRYWESNDGYTVSSRQIRTPMGVVEHVCIGRMGPIKGDIPWAVKQEIKNELFGRQSVAIEVFPAEKNLIDVMDLYHLWVLPKGTTMPFGIHPTRDPQPPVIERGYDYNLQENLAWTESEERKALLGEDEDE